MKDDHRDDALPYLQDGYERVKPGEPIAESSKLRMPNMPEIDTDLRLHIAKLDLALRKIRALALGQAYGIHNKDDELARKILDLTSDLGD